MLKLAYEHDRLAGMPVPRKLEESARRVKASSRQAPSLVFAGSLTWLPTEQVARAKTLECELKRIIPALFLHLSARFTGRPRRNFRRTSTTIRDRFAGRP